MDPDFATIDSLFLLYRMKNLTQIPETATITKLLATNPMTK